MKWLVPFLFLYSFTIPRTDSASYLNWPFKPLWSYHFNVYNDDVYKALDTVFEDSPYYSKLPSKTCQVIEEGSKQNKPCQGIFVFENVTYYGCTTAGSKNGLPWCSTKVDPITSEHVSDGDFFGYCHWLTFGYCLPANKGQMEHDKMTAFQRASFINPSDSDVNKTKPICKCQQWDTCEWSKSIVNTISLHSSDHPTRKFAESFFKSRKCSSYKRKIFCCNDKDAPTVAQMVELKDLVPRTTVPSRSSLKEKASGQWTPDSQKGECGNLEGFIHERIVNGKVANIGDYPYMALLKMADGRYACGGSLINKWYVLTAAHCIEATPKEVLLGEHTVGENPDCFSGGSCAPKSIKIEVDEIITHEKYDYVHGGFDIALLRLKKPVPLFHEDGTKSFIEPVCLPWSNDDSARKIKDSSKALVTGWGATHNETIESENDDVCSTKLRVASVPIVNNCFDLWNEKLKFSGGLGGDQSNYICAGGKNTGDSCNGDSGGPMVYREHSGKPWTQVGVVSFGLWPCAKYDTPAAYTRVDYYIDWIKSKLKP